MSIAREQFETLVRTQHAAVYRTAARLLPPADAEDVTQQAFIAVWEGKTSLGPEPALTLRWLAGRLALNALRGARHRRRHEERRAMQNQPTTTTTSTTTELAADERHALRSALAALPHDLRTAVVLRFQEDLTFEAIALALACSLSTAHDRVRSGLGRLRQALVRGGSAVLVTRLSDLLPRLDAPAAAPPGLEAQLLAVPLSAPAASAAGIWPIAALLLAGGGTIAALAWPQDPAPSAATPSASAALDPSPASAPAPQDQPLRRAIESTLAAPVAAPAARQDAATGEPTARIAGHVFDAADGQPLADAQVSASSLARGRKGEPFLRQTRSDATGHFALDVPIGARGSEAYAIWIQAADYVQHNDTHTLTVKAALDVRAGLRRWAIDRPGEWQLEVTVRDPQGAPLAAADVTVHRRQPATRARREQPQEAAGRTDAAGRVTLRGDHHGEKIVHVGPPAGALAALTRELALTSAGPHALAITLPKGSVVAGVVYSVADGEPIAQLRLSAIQDGDEVGWGNTDDRGRFRFDGCGPTPVTLVAQASEWSPFRAEGFAAGDENIELRLKRRDDPRPHGLHQGELHGRVADAASGEPILVSVWDVDTYWRGAGNGADQVADDEVDDDLLEKLLNPRPVQRSIGGPLPPPAADFHLVGLPAGRGAVIIRHRGYAPAFAGPYALAAGGVISGIDIKLGRGATVSGTVADASGQPVAKAVIYVTASADPLPHAKTVAQALAGNDLYPRHRYPECDAGGAFALRHLPAGLVLRAVAADGRAGVVASEPFTLRDGDTKVLALRLPN